MKKLRLGLLGTGIAAERLYLPAFRRPGRRFEVVACANRTRSKAERFARLAGIPQVAGSADELFALPEVDAVLVSLPIDVQPEAVLAALRAGKPVLSEKPVGPSVAAAKKLIARAERFDVPWLVGENFAFMPHAARLEALLGRGALGEVRVVEASQMTFMGPKNPYFQTKWRTNPKFVGGFVVDAGVHVAHLLRRLFGTPSVAGALTASFEPTLPPLDTVVATLRFPSGALGTWTSSFSSHGAPPLLRVLGSKATAELFWGHLIVRGPAGPNYAPGRETRFDAKIDSFSAEFDHFVDVVQRRARPLVPPREALRDLELLETLVGRGISRKGLTNRARRG